MSNPRFSKCGSTRLQSQTMRYFMLAAILFCCTQFNALQAQSPTLSVQGILKKTNGDAVPDGPQNMTFKLYKFPSGGTAEWMENQTDVEVSSGIYSAILGSVNDLNVSFDQVYYLGVTIGGSEMTPRIQLTGSPYAFALIGTTNLFPGSGLVKADSVKVNGGVLARGGAPGLNGANHHGYAFSGNSGDKDSGLFSTSDGKVSMYVNNVEVLAATPGNVAVAGDVSANNLALASGGSVKYNGLSDWRLFDVDNFETGNEGWNCFTDYYTGTSVTPERVQIGAPVNTGYVLRPTGNSGNAFRKTLNLTGVPHTQVKVVFTAYFFNSVDNGEGVYGAFSTVATPVQNYTNIGETFIGCHAMVPYGGAGEVYSQLNVAGPEGSTWTRRMEMAVRNSDDTIYLILDSTMTEAINNENYGIANIEIWVK